MFAEKDFFIRGKAAIYYVLTYKRVRSAAREIKKFADKEQGHMDDTYQRLIKKGAYKYADYRRKSKKSE